MERATVKRETDGWEPRASKWSDPELPVSLLDLVADHALLTPSEVGEMFRVSPKTVTRWARAGKITAVRTLGGHRRFRAGEVRRALSAHRAEVDVS